MVTFCGGGELMVTLGGIPDMIGRPAPMTSAAPFGAAGDAGSVCTEREYAPVEISAINFRHYHGGGSP